MSKFNLSSGQREPLHCCPLGADVLPQSVNKNALVYGITDELHPSSKRPH